MCVLCIFIKLCIQVLILMYVRTYVFMYVCMHACAGIKKAHRNEIMGQAKKIEFVPNPLRCVQVVSTAEEA